MGFRVVVAPHGMDFLKEGERAAVDRDGGFEDEQFAFELTIGPVDHDERAREAGEQQAGQCRIDPVALALEMTVTEQAVDGLDVMLGKGLAGTPPRQNSCRLDSAIPLGVTR